MYALSISLLNKSPSATPPSSFFPTCSACLSTYSFILEIPNFDHVTSLLKVLTISDSLPEEGRGLQPLVLCRILPIQVWCWFSRKKHHHHLESCLECRLGAPRTASELESALQPDCPGDLFAN